MLFFNQPPIHTDFDPKATIVLKHGDSLEFTSELPGNFVKLVMSSPPYNIGKAYEKRRSMEEYLEDQVPIIREIWRILREDGSVCWQVGNYVEKGEVYPLDIFYYDIFKKIGFKLRNRIIWHFGHGLHATKRFSGRYETILWFTKSDRYTFHLDRVRVPPKYPGKRHYKGPNKGKPSCNPLGKNPSDVWQVVYEDWQRAFWEIPNIKANHPEKTIHPCQFPIELVERCVLALTDPDDWVYDPYMGVGTTLIAALMHKRRAMGCEKEEIYIKVAKGRIEAFYAGNLPYRPLGKPIYQPTDKEKVEVKSSEINIPTNTWKSDRLFS